MHAGVTMDCVIDNFQGGDEDAAKEDGGDEPHMEDCFVIPETGKCV